MALYLEHFGLHEPPFRITPHPDFFFDGADRGATLEGLLYAILHDEGIVKVSGEIGSGKTTLCRVMMERLPAEVETVFLANPSYSRSEILHAIAEELGLPAKLHTHLQTLQPGYTPGFKWLPFALGAAYSIGWIVLLLRLRKSRERPVIAWAATITMIWGLTAILFQRQFAVASAYGRLDPVGDDVREVMQHRALWFADALAGDAVVFCRQ